MMKFDFNGLIDRTGTHSVKWDYFDMKGEVEGMIPMSIADMDFHVPPFITDIRLHGRAGKLLRGSRKMA